MTDQTTAPTVSEALREAVLDTICGVKLNTGDALEQILPADECTRIADAALTAASQSRSDQSERVRELEAALAKIAVLDEADGHELTADDARQAVAIASNALGMHPSQIAAADRAIAPLSVQAKENAKLRQIISDCAAALPNGAVVSPACSVEFMQVLPAEISACFVRLAAQGQHATASPPAPASQVLTEEERAVLVETRELLDDGRAYEALPGAGNRIATLLAIIDRITNKDAEHG